MSACPLGLQVSGPAAWDKATINCRAVQRAHGTKSPTRCPCPQTSHETNVTGLAQKGIIRPVSLNTFTYLRALSVQCFVLAQKEGRAWMEGRGEVVTWGGSQCLCVCMWWGREKNTRREEGNWTHEMDERRSRFPQWQPEPRKHHRVCEEWKEVCMRMCVWVCPPPRGRQEVLLIVVFFFPFFFGLLFLLFCLCYPSCVLFRLIGDLESRANSRQDIL